MHMGIWTRECKEHAPRKLCGGGDVVDVVVVVAGVVMGVAGGVVVMVVRVAVVVMAC